MIPKRDVAIVLGLLALGAVFAVVRPNVPRLALRATGGIIAGARALFGQRVDSDLHVQQHDVAIAKAAAHRDSTRVIADSIDTTVVRPAAAKDTAARRALRRVLAQDTTVALDVDSLKAALTVTAAAATQLDSSSGKLIGGLVALVAAKTAEASASDTVASRAVNALQEERRDRNRERWVYRAKVAGGVLLGIIAGVVASAMAH